MRGKKDSDTADVAFRNVGLPAPLVEDLDVYLDQHPERGYTGRNDFARRAVAEALARCRTEDLERAALEAYRAGQPGPLDYLKRFKT